MTRYERTLQLEHRKNIATGVAAVALAGVMLGGCFYIATNADKNIDLEVHEELEAVETIPEVMEYELACVEVDVVATPLVEEEEADEEIEEVEEAETDANTSEKYSDKDLEELAHLIYAEVGNQSDDCMRYTGSVVLNRVASKKYPNTIHKVINQKGQYGVRKTYMKKKPSDKAYEIAQELLEGGSVLPEGVLGQAGKATYKKWGKKLYAKIGKVYFFYI